MSLSWKPGYGVLHGKGHRDILARPGSLDMEFNEQQ
jgi:hypothetical protein